MPKIFLIRHCATHLSSRNCYCGVTDPELSADGIKQAKCLTARLKDERIETIYTSDLRRAYRTAEIIAGGRPLRKMKDLREADFGVFEGLCREDIMRCHPKSYAEWISDPWHIKAPNGESAYDLSVRIERAYRKIVSLGGGTKVIVSHGGPLRILLCMLLKRDPKTFRELSVDLGSLSVVDRKKDAPAQVVTMNDTAHLTR